MAFNGSGVYSLPTNSFAQAVTGTTISSSGWNSTGADLATALTLCVTKDGQSTTTAAVPFAGGGIKTDDIVEVTSGHGVEIDSVLIKDNGVTATSVTTTQILDTGGNEEIKFVATASAVNEFTVTNAATGNGPILSATGGDTNIDLNLTPKGTGDVVANADLRVTGATAIANSQSDAYTTVAADANKMLLHPTADDNARTFTIDSNDNVPYAVGTVILFVNEINTLSIAITDDTLVLAGTGGATTGTRTMAAMSMAVAVKKTSTSWIISGTGIS